jgi:hypothetical protein
MVMGTSARLGAGAADLVEAWRKSKSTTNHTMLPKTTMMPKLNPDSCAIEAHMSRKNMFTMTTSSMEDKTKEYC